MSCRYIIWGSYINYTRLLPFNFAKYDKNMCKIILLRKKDAKILADFILSTYLCVNLTQ